MHEQTAFFDEVMFLMLGVEEYAIGQDLKIKTIPGDQVKLPSNFFRQNYPSRFINA